MHMKNKIVLPLFLGLALAAGCTRTKTDTNKLSSTDQPNPTPPTATADQTAANQVAIAQKDATGQPLPTAADTAAFNATKDTSAIPPTDMANASTMAATPVPAASASPAPADIPAASPELNPTPATTASADVASATAESKPVTADRIAEWKLSADAIKTEFDRTGRIDRSKTVGAGEPTGPMDDVLVTQINGSLKADPATSSATITVAADKGVVTLKGSAQSLDQIGRAVAVALNTGGVTQAISLIKLDATTQP
jgi:hypothetical protein